MSKFKLFNKSSHTAGDLFKAACTVKTPEDAETFMTEYVDYMREHAIEQSDRDNPEGVCKSNVGYVLGYGADNSTVQLFNNVGAVHPVFGENYPTGDQAFEAGVKAARPTS